MKREYGMTAWCFSIAYSHCLESDTKPSADISSLKPKCCLTNVAEAVTSFPITRRRLPRILIDNLPAVECMGVLGFITKTCLYLLHCFSNLALHIGSSFGRASGKLHRPPFSAPRNIIEEQLHLSYFTDLRLNYLIRKLANARIANACLPRIINGN